MWRSAGIAPPVLNIGTVRVIGQLHAPAALFPRKDDFMSIGQERELTKVLENRYK
jgi:hypothetical protein